MKTIYIDYDYKCHLTNDGTMTAVETNFFDGKCDTFVEGYRFVPAGESWIREDGAVFHGEMITPWKDSQLLETVQALYEETTATAEDVTALREENALLMECILEMSEIVYA